LPSVQGFATPLGVIRVDYEKLERMALCPYIVMQALQKTALPGKFELHKNEYSIEVVLPMLQYKMKKVRLAPYCCREFTDNMGKRAICI
jgi:AmmeMemoRadiSam system protein B